MNLLIVSATYMEIAPLLAKLKFISENDHRMKFYSSGKNEIDVLITGVGMVATATWTALSLSKKKYDAAINFGVCGSFDKSLEIGKVVNVLTDRIPELGAEDDEKFLSIHEMNLLGENEFPFMWGQLVNQSLPNYETILKLTGVNGISVNTAHGNISSIEKIVKRVNPHIESMEGAAFFYACMVEKIPCAQIRAVSNVIEKRNREHWNMALAIKNLNEVATDIINHI
ncbi:MAG: futalosine hydrolase [Bacteroidetes bacterium]|nr:futalosine hydrolase [Bacteroidota bacterium]